MATKLYDLHQNLAVTAGATSITPALRDMVAGVETAVAPDIVFMVPKAVAMAPYVTTALGTGAIALGHDGGGAQNFDVLAIRLHSIQRVLAGLVELYAFAASPNIAGAGGTYVHDPLLVHAGVALAPDFVYPIKKAVGTAVTDAIYVPTVLAAGNITCTNDDAGPIAQDTDILMIYWNTIQRLTAAQFGEQNSRNRAFTILNVGPDASVGAIYTDNDDPTRRYLVTRAKVSADGSTELRCRQIGGTTNATTGGADILTRVYGTGDATIAYTGCYFEKYVHLESNYTVLAAGSAIDFGLMENGARVMPDIVIPVPKITARVPYVTTDLTGAVGTVNVQVNTGNAACDILALRAHSIFRDT